MATQQDFERAFELLIGHEGGFTENRNDRGNWTSGIVGQGELRGTKWGISAMSYPSLDIRNLTLAQAHEIHLRDFWNCVAAPEMPPRLAFIVFDSAVNNGLGSRENPRAIAWLQTAVGVAAGSAIGPVTREAIRRATAADEMTVVVEFHAQRMRFMVGLTGASGWSTFGGGWSRRLARLPLEAAHHWPDPMMVDAPAPVNPPVAAVGDEAALEEGMPTVLLMLRQISDRLDALEDRMGG